MITQRRKGAKKLDKDGPEKPRNQTGRDAEPNRIPEKPGPPPVSPACGSPSERAGGRRAKRPNPASHKTTDPGKEREVSEGSVRNEHRHASCGGRRQRKTEIDKADTQIATAKPSSPQWCACRPARNSLARGKACPSIRRLEASRERKKTKEKSP